MLSGWLSGWRAIPPRQRGALTALLMLVLAVNIRQPFPAIAPLHHIPTLILIATAPWWWRRWPLSDRGLFGLLGVFALHSIGARWTYSSVPYDDWAKALSGNSLSDMFGWTRNHYDRLVHFAFGLLLVRPMIEWLRPLLPTRPFVRLAGAVLILLAISAAYELFEWALTFTVPAAMADDYNGQQGDAWDAQKDMAIALLGSLIAALWALRRR